MDMRVLLFLLVLGTSWCCSAKVVSTSLSPVENGIASVLQMNQQQLEKEVEAVEEFGDIKDVCSLCQVVAIPVLEYLSNSTTKTYFIGILYLMCSLASDLEDNCTKTVVNCASEIFSQLSVLTPRTLCIKIGLCDQVVFMSQHISENSFEFCHLVVTEASLKLKDPDSTLDIVELLLKACDAVEASVKNCKRMVLINSPLIPVYTEQFLQRQRICTMLHTCSSANDTKVQTSSSQTSMHSSS